MLKREDIMDIMDTLCGNYTFNPTPSPSPHIYSTYLAAYQPIFKGILYQYLEELFL
jgi:hypothetical protein